MAIQKKFTLDKDLFEGFVDARDCLIAINAVKVLFGKHALQIAKTPSTY